MLWQKIPAMEKAEIWYLETALFFLHGVSMVAYIAANSGEVGKGPTY